MVTPGSLKVSFGTIGFPHKPDRIRLKDREKKNYFSSFYSKNFISDG